MEDSPIRLLCPWDSPGKDVGVGCHALLQGIFPIQVSNLGPPAVEAESLPSEPLGKKLERQAFRMQTQKSQVHLPQRRRLGANQHSPTDRRKCHL